MARPSPTDESSESLLVLAAEIASAYARNNHLQLADIGTFLVQIHTSLREMTGEIHGELTPAVPIKKSITDDFIICLEDGRKLKTLKRYLMRKHGLTPDAYRKKWRLSPDYPMVAPDYARRRSQFAKDSGLGRKPQPSRRRKKPT